VRLGYDVSLFTGPLTAPGWTTSYVTTGNVPNIDESEFLKFAEAAKSGCIISRALGGVGEITLDATLVS